MKRKITIVLSVIALLAISFSANYVLSLQNPEVETPDVDIAKRHVKVKKVVYGEIESQVVASGRIVSQSMVDVASEVQGKILQGNIPLKKGQSFKKGDILLRIYSEEFQLALQSKKSRFLTSIANILPDLKIDYNDSYKTWASFFDEIEIDKKLPLLPDIQSKKEKIFLASKNILSDYYSILSDEIRLSKYNITAAFNGVYTQVNSEVGSIANPGVRLGQIIRTNQLELEVPIKSDEIKWLNKGDKTVVNSEDGLLSWNGKISRISQFVDENTQSISVFVSIETNSENKLYNGQYLKAIFPGKVIESGMELPRNAIFNFNKVFIVDDGKLLKRTVSIEKYNQNSIIISGIPEGTNVVWESLVNAIENTQVVVSNID